MLSILKTYEAKGRFDSTSEAYAYLRGYIEPQDRAALIRMAESLPEPERTQWLTRLSSPAYDWRISRNEAMDRMQRMTAAKLAREAEHIVSSSASSAVTEGARRAHYSAMKEAGVGWRFDLPNEGQIREVLGGVGVYDKVKLFSKQEMQGVRTTVTQGILSGRSYDDIGRLVAQQTDKEVYKARRLVRTTMAQAATDSKTKTYQDLGIEEYEIVCVLDERTCPICAKYDGKVYRTGKGPRPTFHPNCRCTMRQVMPEKMRERMQRSARDAQGNTIRVPASMSYADWAKQYGSPSAQRKLGDIMTEEEAALSIREAQKDPDKPALPKASQEYAPLTDKQKHKIEKFVSTAPKTVRSAWDDTVGDLAIHSTKSTGSYYDPILKGVYLDLAADVRGSEIKAPYSVTFHELGHNMAAVYAERAGFKGDDITNHFRSKKYSRKEMNFDTFKEEDVGYTLSEMIKDEAKEHIQRHEDILKQKVVKEGGDPAKIVAMDTYSSMRGELSKLEKRASGDVSDMFSGATEGMVWTTTKHDGSYWETHPVGMEAFAEMMSATMACPESLEAIQRYFPKSYDIFLEILKSGGKLE